MRQPSDETDRRRIFYAISIANKGMLTTESKVVQKVPCDMVVSSLPICIQNIVPKLATGIAINIMLIEDIRVSIPIIIIA